MAADDYRAYPAAASGIALSSDPSTAWVYGTTQTIVPASTITVPIYFVSLVILPTDSAGPDTTYQSVFSVLINDVEKIVIPFVWRADTAVGYYRQPHAPITLGEMHEIPANASVKVKVAASTVRNYTVKMFYREGSADGGQGVSVTGLDSAGSFGSLLAHMAVPVTGLGSAAQFGLVDVDQTIFLMGLNSAALFGVPSSSQAIIIGGLGSAAEFGTATVFSLADFNISLQASRIRGRH